ncbi:beta-hexosaminidase subunit alpha isoform X2 [Strongylocentrotus purpuratus]|uniref:Beta-hexosaminidase n=1 Tax=Strongylocentrotus purpuratus TaxID=7668 RepID=A0A7M7N870_STRPU|nr:beta-hexosaminidase subunit alpha isoform X2 [Strongylocentrotus purpuratus]
MAGVWMQIAWVLVLCSVCLASLSENQDGVPLPLKAVTSSTQGSPWPMPQSITVMPVVYNLVGESQFMFTASKVQCDILDSAFKRYLGIIFFNKPRASKRPRHAPTHLRFRSAATELRGLNVAVEQPCPDYPQLESDESYSLTISDTSASLAATSVWGALRGLETFSQLIYDNEDGQLVINKTSITDFPRFSFRGYLVDTSRHFLSMSSIFKSLDAMAYNKFNVFHWHIVDDQSFPYESKAYPSLSRMNAYDQNHVYTRENVKAVIEYARLRGIRVMPEFDTPGHTQSWVSIPDLLTPCYSGTTPTGGYGPINPTIDANYDFLKIFFKEVVDLFPDHYVHMGGDEVSFSCWASNPAITDFMTQHQYGKNYSMLEQYYEQRLLDIMADLQTGYTVWQEIIDNQVKVRSDTVVHVWKGPYPSELANVTAKGYKTILSTPWYLNYISYGDDWRKYYVVEPTLFNGTDAQKKLVIGGEVCMWGEYVDSTNVIQRTWPRASAVGERLWSSVNVTSLDDASHRLVEQRCRMVKRGIQAEPIVGPNFCPYEYEE